jgi:ribosomal protein L11 methyltransferase
MNIRRWIRLLFLIPGSHQDLLIGQLAALGFEGFLQETDSLEAYIAYGKWGRGLRDRVAYCLGQFHREFPSLPLNYATSTIDRRNWNREWERSIRIVDATPRIVIKPSWKRLRRRDRGKMVLQIDPKMSFGTGHHETTRLCLLMLEEYVAPRMSVLDFGSGTGILAIASIKLGASKAVAVDNDEWTISNIRENLKRNHVDRKVKVLLGSTGTVRGPSFDLIVANIDLPTVKKVHAPLLRKLRKGGIFIISGILTSDLLEVYSLMAHKGVAPVNLVEENEWSAIAMVKP